MQILGPSRLRPFPTIPTQKSLDQILAFLNLYEHVKNQFIPSVNSSDTVNFTVPWPNWPHLFLTMSTPLWFCYSLEKISYFYLFSLEISQFWSPETRLTTLSFDHAQPKKFPSTFDFWEFVATCKKWGYFIDLLWRNSWFKNPAIWLAQSILGYISETRFFPNIGFVQEHSK